jgi:regulatory protein
MAAHLAKGVLPLPVDAGHNRLDGAQAVEICRAERRRRRLLDFLEQNNWLSQERFSASLIHRRGARYGNSRIVAELQSHGVNGEALQELKSGLAGSEVERASEVWRRKFGEVAAEAQERGKQMRFLMQRGFSQKAIRAAMRGTCPEDD